MVDDNLRYRHQIGSLAAATPNEMWWEMMLLCLPKAILHCRGRNLSPNASCLRSLPSHHSVTVRSHPQRC